MCGIAGVFNRDGSPADSSLAGKMIQRLRHRGPDACGVASQGAAALGHARLSIIDIAGGQQPMSLGDGHLSITFNGEIYNYVELREELKQQGCTFRTQSDTEVILHLYARDGIDCVRHLNGQWAFAIWDSISQSLFLSRDRMGVRPLFHTQVDGTFLFASEIKALFGHPRVERAIDPLGMDQCFTLWAPVPPRTAFKHIAELPPGCSLRVSAGKAEQFRHWEANYPSPVAATEKASAEELLSLLVEATRLRLRADVPVAAYLSGGIDSTAIASIATRFTGRHLRTFSVSFDDPEFDESTYQRQAAEWLGTEHENVRCSTSDIGEIFPEVVWHAERPLFRTAAAPMFLLSRLVRDRGYKVVLTGEGADEILGGYDIFKETKIRQFCAAMPNSRLRPLLLRRLYPYLPGLQTQSDHYLRAFFGATPADCSDPFFSHTPRWTSAARLRMFYSQDLRATLENQPCAIDAMRALLPPEHGEWDPFTRAQFIETAHLLPGYILSSQGDRVAMAHGVEGRYPFLDPRVVAFAASLPPTLKMKSLQEKYLLKRAVAGLVPEGVLRRTKQPYRAPDAVSFFGGETAAGYVEDLLTPARIHSDGLFDAPAVAALLAKARAGRATTARDNAAFVGILSTQLLVDRFIRNSN
jgi:asparagine synthase (glutamine-hydrolysing)